MSQERDPSEDPLVESLLEEAFQRVRPPDVTLRVVERLSPDGARFPPLAAMDRDPLPPAERGMGRPPGAIRRGGWTRRRVGRAWQAWAGLGTAAAAAVVLIAWGAGLFTSDERDEPAMAGRRPAGARDAAHDVPRTRTPPTHAAGAEDHAPRGAGAAAAADAEPRRHDAGNRATDAAPPKAERVSPRSAPPRGAPPGDDRQIVQFIDETLREAWRAAGVRPSQRASDTEWCRRLFLALLGRIPTVDELNRFIGDPSAGKRAELVDRLLDSPEYAEEYARAWTTVWANALVGRMGGAGDLSHREGLEQYLRRALLSDKPYDEMAGDLIGAVGATKPGEPDFNGAANFLISKLDADAVQATTKTAQVFLGVQIQCVQCHNHPFNDWKQSRFWELNAFFRQARALAAGGAAGTRSSPQLVDQDFAGEGDGDPREAEVYFEQPNGLLKVAYPVFLDGTAIGRSGFVDEVNRRRELARLVRASPLLAEAAVNRFWAHFFGQGFTRPVDDLGPHNPPSHPALLNRLAREFAAHRYDVKALMRWIVHSEAYALSSRANATNVADDPLRGEGRPLFSRYYLRPLRAEQLYESLVVAGGAERTDDFAQTQRRKTEWLREYTLAYGTDECDECSLLDGSFVQTLMMMNGELTARATDSERAGFLRRVALAEAPSGQKIQQLFLAAFARRPSSEELRIAGRLLAARGAAAEGLEDVWWTLLNSSEFISDR